MDLMPLTALFFQSIPETIIMYLLGFSLTGLNINENYKKLVLAGVMASILSYFIRALPFPFGIHTILLLPLQIIVVMLLLRISVKQSMIAVMVGLIVQAIIEIIYVPAVSLLFGIPISELIKDPLLRIIVPWPYQMLMLILSIYFYRRDITIFPLVNLLGTRLFNTQYSLIALVLIQCILLGLINTSLLLNTDIRGSILAKNIIIYSSIILFLMLLSLLLVRRLLESVRREMAAESQNLFLKNVNDLFNSIRAQRHDFINHVHTINGLLSIEKYDLAKEYAKTLVKDTVELNYAIRLNEPFLASLLKSKLAFADSKNIKLTINTDTTLKKFKFNNFELTRLIGNLVDNAFDAVIDLPEDERIVELNIKKYSDFYIFEISNSGPGIPQKVLKSIFTAGFSTKPEHTGLGLAIVKQLVDKNGGSIGVKSEPGATVFTLTLPNK